MAFNPSIDISVFLGEIVVVVVVVVGFTTLFNILGHQRRFRHRA